VEKEVGTDWKKAEDYDEMLRRVVDDRGYHGLVYSNAQEGSGASYAFSNPSILRSRFAAFDPARVNENDMLGFVNPRLLAALGLGSAAAFAGNSLLNSGKQKMEDAKKARQQAIDKAEEK
jgi:hypothetical protein